MFAVRLECAEGLVMPSKEGLYTDTITLKWCTPKSTTVGVLRYVMQHYTVVVPDVAVISAGYQ